MCDAWQADGGGRDLVLNEPKIKRLALSLAAETFSAVAGAEAKSSQLDLAAADRVRQGTADTPAEDGLMGKEAVDTHGN